MQRFARGLIDRHCVGADWPGFVGTVELGEPFVVETANSNAANGPVRVVGVGAVLHVAAQVGGAGLCLADVHAYQGQGELAVVAALPKHALPG